MSSAHNKSLAEAVQDTDLFRSHYYNLNKCINWHFICAPITLEPKTYALHIGGDQMNPLVLDVRH